MSDGGGNSITIPDNVKKTIQSIREITGKKHSDEDVYSVLQECSMDPDDTAQKLLYLDTFHEVKRKCDWRKGTQGRGTRGGQGNFSGAVGGRNVATRRENGVVRMTDRSASNLLHSVQKKNNTAVNPVTKDLSTTSCDPSTLSNRSSIRSHGPQLAAAADAGSTAHTVKSDSSSSSDPILAPSMTRNPGAVGTIKCEVGCQRKAAEQNNIQGNKKISLSKSKAVGKSQLSESLQPSTLSTYNDSLVVRSSANDSHSSEELAKSLKTVLSEDAQAKVSSQLLPEPSITTGHVKFPNHFKVPEALKSGLTFGSFESNYGPGKEYINGGLTFGSFESNSGPGKEYINGGLTFGSFDSNSGPETKCSNAIDGDINSTLAVELTHSTVENARPFSNDSGSSPMQVDHSYQPESPQPVVKKVLISEDNNSPGADSKVVQSKQDAMLLPECHQNSTVQISPSYGFGIMPPLQAAHPVPFVGHETQAPDISQLSGFVGENSMATSTSSPSQSMQHAVAASLHPLLFRPPYPLNYLQYGHYFNPYFLPPMHQFLSHNGLPRQPLTGNAFLTSAPAAAGVKFPFPLPQFKPGTTARNPTPVALPTLYGSYGSSPMGFNPGPAVSPGSSAGNDDLSAFQLKERNIYTTGSLSEVSSWIPPPGQDISSLQLSSLYQLHPQGQHLTFSPPQAGHGTFRGFYPPLQTMAAPSTVNQLMQQSQAMPATAEPVVPSSGPYQQSQHTQINWNS